MEELIKIENNMLCHGCLSSDRQISSLRDLNKEIYLSIINQQECSIYETNDIKFCWECMATLTKFKRFRTQLLKAQDALMQILYGLGIPTAPLSNLTTTTKLFYDQEIQYTRNKRKNKKKISEDNIKQIKTEIIYPDVQDTLTDIINNEDTIDNEEKVSSEVKIDYEETNQELTDAFEDNLDDTYIDTVKEEKCEITAKKPKKKGHNEMHWKTLYKEYATLIETEEKEWGDTKTYYTTVYFDEEEMERYIFVKERYYANHERYSFSCSPCKLGYKSHVDLKRHNNLNHRKPGASHRCSLCQKVMSSHDELKSHWREHTPIAKCNLCGNVMRIRGMKQHLTLSHTKRYACAACRMTFETLSKFGQHYKEAHMNYTCDYCRKVFKSKSRIAYHIRNYHVKTHCELCNRSYLNRSQYNKHCTLVHPKLVNRKEPPELRFCVECNKQFPSIVAYRNHLKVSIKHTDVKKQPAACPECGKVFSRKLYMKNHYNLYHLKKTKNYCDLCDKYFARPFGLRVHNAHVHQKVPKVRDKICDLCGRAFTHNRTMLNHRRTHTGERPHKCPYCTAEFIQKYAMQTHVKTQHKQFT